MAKSIVIQRLTETAEKLYQCRKSIENYEYQAKTVLDMLKAERDALQADLIAKLTENELSTIKVSSGDSFTKAIRRGINVTNEITALKWAMDKGAVNINKILVAQKLKDAKEIPSGFEITETPYISVRHAKKVEEIIS